MKSKIDKEDLKIIIDDYNLIYKNNVIITPHNAFNTEEAIQRILTTSAFNIKSFIKKKEVNLVK